MEIQPTEYRTSSTPSKYRINSFTGQNELESIPSITFHEQLVTLDQLTGARYVTPVGSIAVSLTEPSKPLPIKSPVDDTDILLEQFVGKITAQNGLVYEDVMIVLYSLGRNVQIERDTALQVQP